VIGGYRWCWEESVEVAAKEESRILSDKPFLTGIHQHGPDRERAIFGLCSACGYTLIARLDEGVESSPELLRIKLDKVFEQHKAEYHATQEISNE
jgi:hypothetical protein